jgi:NADH-quinone oxidoreductase subunit E/NADP-reducing hydrogenase subunit HndA
LCKFQPQEGELINVLHQVQHKLGYLPAEVQELVAMELNIPVAKVYGVVTFYSFFTMLPQGENPISVAWEQPVLLEVLNKFWMSSQAIENRCRRNQCRWKILVNALRCVGACGLAPVVMVGDRVHGRVSPSDVKKILAECIDGCLTHN